MWGLQCCIKEQRRGHQVWGGAEFAISNRVVREGSTEKVTFEQRLEDTERVNPIELMPGEEAFQTEGTSKQRL